MNTAIMIKATHVSKTFHVKDQNVEVLRDVSFDIKKGDFLIIFGPSGCGKSTLLHILLGLEEPTQGTLEILEKNIYVNTTEDDRSEVRKKHIGMVYQEPTWIKSLSVVENLVFPLLLMGESKASAAVKAYQSLKSLDMSKWAEYYPSELSSGQQQKIALLRSMITNPEMIIADEPTGNLDYESGQELMKMLTQINKQGKTIIMVTHDLAYLAYAQSAVQMFNGQVVQKYTSIELPNLLAKTKLKQGQIL